MTVDEAYQHFLDTQLIGVAHHDAVTRKAFFAGVQFGIDGGKNFHQSSRGTPLKPNYMLVCIICGNKRCPHANDPEHYACTGSNEPGQVGSNYPKP
jgi:hypothetical protein